MPREGRSAALTTASVLRRIQNRRFLFKCARWSRVRTFETVNVDGELFEISIINLKQPYF